MWSHPAATALATSTAVALVSMSLPGCGRQGTDGNMTSAMDLLPAQIESWTLDDSSTTYDRETIFDYINGAGEVYRSYAFNQVTVVEYTSPNDPNVAVEVFDMGNPADAYGVFSYAREQEETGIGDGYEQRGRVLCFWQDRYYVCVTMEETPEESDTTLTHIAREISRNLPPLTGRPPLVSRLPAERLIPSSERFFHLHQSLNYHYYLARENILNLAPQTDVVMGRYDPGTTYLLIVAYPNGSAAQNALTSFRAGYQPESPEAEIVRTENGKLVASRNLDRHVVVVLDADSRAVAEDLLQASADNLIEPPR